MKVDISKPAKKTADRKETIEEHTSNVLHVGDYLIQMYGSEIEELEKDIPSLQGYEAKRGGGIGAKGFIRDLLTYHDFGKVNPNFTTYIEEGGVSGEKKEHAIYSFLIWLAEQPEIGSGEQKEELREIFVMAYAIITGHHNRLREWPEGTDEEIDEKIKKKTENMVSWEVITKHEMSVLRRKVESFIMKASESKVPKKEWQQLTFVKIAYAILIVSDSIASSPIQKSEYQQVLNRLFNQSLQEDEIYRNVLKPIANSEITKKVESSHWTSENSFSEVVDMNDVRILLNKKATSYVSDEKNIYILEAPVGTGKTMAALSLAQKLIEGGKRKIVSVFPLNSVQAQFQKMITDENEMGVKDDFVDVINSETLFKIDNEKQAAKAESLQLSANDLWLLERNCFSSPLLITSHVRFFETLASMNRGNVLGFLSLKDSVVIIDEFQNYPDKYWRSIWSELSRLSKLLGVKWIFTTGTFPVAKGQLEEYTDVHYVLNDEENRSLFQHPAVNKRFYVEEMKHEKYKNAAEAAEGIVEDIQCQLQKGVRQFLVCLTLVDESRVVYEAVKKELRNECDVHYLCGRHSSAYKLRMIELIKKWNEKKEEKKKVVLVTTKTVECGMDFDFEMGYKEFDMFDSVEQFAGRINRSNLRTQAKVKLFQTGRKGFEKEKLYKSSPGVVEDINNKEFRRLYEEMYIKSGIKLKRVEKRLNSFHRELKFGAYRTELELIKQDDYLQEMYLVTTEEEEEFVGAADIVEISGGYADKVVGGKRIAESLSKYKVRVTSKWLEEYKKDYFREEKTKKNGIVYLVPINNNWKSLFYFDELSLKDEAEEEENPKKLISLVERVGSITYEFF